MTLSSAELARYGRHLSLRELGVAGQQKLKAASVLVVGAGGLGSPSLLYLAAAGVGTLGMVDFDKVDISNLQRQVLFDTASVGHSKVDAAKARLLALNPHVQINVHAVELRAANVMDIVAQYDVILDGTDRFATRYLVNDACVLLGKPLVSAAIHRFEGQAFTYVPRQGPCYRCLFPEPPADGAVPNCAEAGVLGVLPGVLGTLQATEAIKLITGVGTPLLGRLLTYDALDMRFAEFKFAARAECAVCGVDASIKLPQDMEAVCATADGYQTITAPQLRSLLHSGSELLLLDVREPEEFAAGHLPNARNVPLAQLAQQFAQLPQVQTMVLMCRGGGRSARACNVLAELQSDSKKMQLINLDGGLLAWHLQVDSSLIVI